MNDLEIERENLAHLPVDPSGTAPGRAFVPISFAGTCLLHHGQDYGSPAPGEGVDRTPDWAIRD